MASTLFDQGDILNYLISSNGPFKLVLTNTPPAGTESYATLTGSALYPGYTSQTLTYPGDFSSPGVVSGTTVVTNANDVSFPTPTGNGSLTIGGYALFDAAGTPNMRRYGALASPLPAPTTGQTIKIPAGQFSIGEG